MENQIISPRQIRAARALLDWSVHDLGEKAGVAGTTVSAIERGKNVGSVQTLQKFSAVMISAGIEFLENEGVRPAQNRNRVLRGAEGVRIFYDEIYELAKNGPLNICAMAANMAVIRHWVRTVVPEHRARMEALQLALRGDVGRYLYADSHKDDITVNYGTARYLPADKFPDTTIYIYGNRVAFEDYQMDSVEITIVENARVADAQRRIFDMLWKMAKLSPD